MREAALFPARSFLGWKLEGGRQGLGRRWALGWDLAGAWCVHPYLTPIPVPAGRPCVDCHAFEFMQRALQDLRKTAYSLDARVSTQGQGGVGLVCKHPKI